MEKKKNIPTKEQNPNGLHQRYEIRKITDIDPRDSIGLLKTTAPFLYPVSKPVDPNAEYFVMRLDTGGSDINHIKACRIGIHAYADAIEATMPELAKDLRERYPLL